ncbi:acetoin utilization AcuB family protein [Lysinibacillus odysseyi]|uniref:Acetoin utilization protein AcuB n=1 Tax=Lysinibacillus odysseyi 34hs-1 = NBRC 100172 TaxID=1220589 RepID=A0A0A3IIC4_9BACI|nr:acetoin utilization AcuB family protein [Lysinibacillus odysseyi]KGR83205.1 acetoin utilization protein AcuB [Lysinibacillus odysseyi 34hs-1 = NBRC 100172]
MIVEEIMQTDLYTLAPTDTVGDAVRLMSEKKVRHLPVVNENFEILGIVTGHDLKNVLPAFQHEKQNSSIYDAPLEQIMVKDPIIGHPLDFVEEVAVTLYENRISCLPIVSKGKLAGIVTTTDVLYRYIELTGANRPSSKLDIRVTNKPGILYDITRIFRQHKVNVLSILVYPDSENENSRILSIRLQVMNPLAIIEDLRKEKFDVLWPNLPGIEL